MLLTTDPLLDLAAMAPLLRVKQGRLLTQAGDVAEASEVASAEIPKLRSKTKKPGKTKTKAAKAKVQP